VVVQLVAVAGPADHDARVALAGQEHAHPSGFGWSESASGKPESGCHTNPTSNSCSLFAGSIAPRTAAIMAAVQIHDQFDEK
jgi:hypothetical protein